MKGNTWMKWIKNESATVHHFLWFLGEKDRFVGKISEKRGRFFESNWYFLMSSRLHLCLFSFDF